MKKSPHFLFCFALILLVACTEKGKPIVRHEPPQTSNEAPATATQENEKDNAPVIEGDVQTLGARVLDFKRVRDLSQLNSRRNNDELIQFNKMLILTPSAQRSSLLPLFKQYVAVLRLECENLKASCPGLNYLRRAGNSTEVLKMIALTRSFEAQREHLLLTASEMKNRLADPELLRLLILYVSPQKDSARSLIEASLLTAGNSLPDKNELRGFLNSIPTWDLVTGRRWKLNTSAQTALWSMIAKAHFLYDDKGQLNVGFKRLIVDLEAHEESLANTQKKARENKFKPEPLGVVPVNYFDELVFLADSVYLQKISPQTAVELFRSSPYKAQDLEKFMTNYVRLRFAFAMDQSSNFARTIFNAPVLAENLLSHALQQSPLVKKVWGTLEARLVYLRGFATAAVSQMEGGVESEKKMQQMFTSFGRQVNLCSVYPHSLILFHKMSQKRFRILIRQKEYDSAELMQVLFHGMGAPLLDYTNEKTPLNHFEILHAFDMAVRGQVFDSMKVDVDVFISDTVDRLTQAPIEYIENTLDRIDRRFAESQSAQDLRYLCRELEGAKPMPRVMDLNDVRMSPYLGRAVETIFLPLSKTSRDNSAGSPDQFTLGLFYADQDYAEALEKVRLDLAMYERVGTSMLDSYTDYLTKFERLGAAEVQKRTTRSRARLETIRKLRTRTLTTGKTWLNDYGRCYYQLAQKDFDFTNEVIKLEVEYLRGVHRDITLLRRTNLSEMDRQRILKRYQFKNMPGGFTGLDRIERDGYQATSIDFLIRSLNHVHRLAPHISPNFGSVLNMDVDLVRTTEIVPLAYTESEQDFIDSGLRAYFPRGKNFFAFWLHNAGERFTPWIHFEKSLVSFYRLEVESSGSAQILTPQLLLGMHEQVLSTTALNEDDRRLYASLHLDNRITTITLDEVLLKYLADEQKSVMVMQGLWSLFDLPTMLIGREKIGFDYDLELSVKGNYKDVIAPRRFGFIEMGSLYYNARSAQNRGQAIIPFNPTMDRSLDQNIRLNVQRELKAIQGFQSKMVNHIEDLNRLPPEQRPRADVDVRQSITDMLSEHLIADFDSRVRDFRRSTQDCLVRQTCTEFK